MALLWTLKYTELSAPLKFSLLFSSKDIVKIHLCVVFGTTAFKIWMKGKMHGMTSWEGFSVNSPPPSRSTPYHLTLFTRSPRLYHMKLYISLFPVLHLTLFNDCATSSVYYACVMRHASPNKEESLHFISGLKVTRQQYFFPHTVFKNGPRTARCSGYDEVCRQQPSATL